MVLLPQLWLGVSGERICPPISRAHAAFGLVRRPMSAALLLLLVLLLLMVSLMLMAAVS